MEFTVHDAQTTGPYSWQELPGALSHGEAFAHSEIVLPYVTSFLAQD